MDTMHGGGSNRGVDRRLFLGGSVGVIPFLSPSLSIAGLPASAVAGQRTREGRPMPGLIARQRNPGKDVAFSWRFWEHTWQTPTRPGRHVLMARATDARGRVQPMKRDDDRRDAVISHVLPIEVEIEG